VPDQCVATPLGDSIGPTGDPLKDGLLQGSSWSFSGARILPYSFNVYFDYTDFGQPALIAADLVVVGV